MKGILNVLQCCLFLSPFSSPASLPPSYLYLPRDSEAPLLQVKALCWEIKINSWQLEKWNSLAMFIVLGFSCLNKHVHSIFNIGTSKWAIASVLGKKGENEATLSSCRSLCSTWERQKMAISCIFTVTASVCLRASY